MTSSSCLWNRFAAAVAQIGLAVIFLLFLVGVSSRHFFDKPQGWIDEAVTLLCVWVVLWTAAFVLKWTDLIAFDILFMSAKPHTQRVFLLFILPAFFALMAYALPTMVEYTRFIWRERSDQLQIPLHYVYAIFPFFFIVMEVRILIAVYRLLGKDWRNDLAAHWGAPSEVS